MVVVERAKVFPAVLNVNCELPASPSESDSCGTVDDATVSGKMREVDVPILTIPPGA